MDHARYEKLQLRALWCHWNLNVHPLGKRAKSVRAQKKCHHRWPLIESKLQAFLIFRLCGLKVLALSPSQSACMVWMPWLGAPRKLFLWFERFGSELSCTCTYTICIFTYYILHIAYYIYMHMHRFKYGLKGRAHINRVGSSLSSMCRDEAFVNICPIKPKR